MAPHQGDDQRPIRPHQEADVHELGRRVAQRHGYQSVLLDNPADDA
jgi:hypothetical protein